VTLVLDNRKQRFSGKGRGDLAAENEIQQILLSSGCQGSSVCEKGGGGEIRKERRSSPIKKRTC